MHHRSRTPVPRPLNNRNATQLQPIQPPSNNQLPLDDCHNANPLTASGPGKLNVDINNKITKEVIPSLVICNNNVTPSMPLQPMTGLSPRIYNHQDRNRIPYSAALAGSNTKMRELKTPSSSSLATQIELSSSSVNGDHPVKKCGSTSVNERITMEGLVNNNNTITAPTTPSSQAEDGTLSLYIANLPFIANSFPLERVHYDLLTHLSRTAKVDSLKVRFGKAGRYNSRQVLAFASFSNMEEAKKLLNSRSTMFMGCHLRVEVTNYQRTLTLSSTKDPIDLEPLKALTPWCENKQHFPSLYQINGNTESVPFTRMLVRELCSAFGLIVRIHTESAPFEVLFADVEHCRRARDAFTRVASLSGIKTTIEDVPHKNKRPAMEKSESDVEFSSSCLPIKTDSSSNIDLSSVHESEDVSTESVQAVKGVELGGDQIGADSLEEGQASPMSPLTEIPPTPTLSNTLEASESEVDEQEEESSNGLNDVPSIKSGDETVARTPCKEPPVFLRKREIDPCSVFVSRLPEVDNIEECLFGLFSSDGRIKQLRVMLSKQTPQNKFAFITFDDHVAVQKALSRNNQIFLGKVLNVRPRETNTSPRRPHDAQIGFLTRSELIQEEEKKLASLSLHKNSSLQGVGSPQVEANAPSTMIRFGSNPTSPCGQGASQLSPTKRRGASLPNRPLNWSPSKETRTGSYNDSPNGSGIDQPPMSQEGSFYPPSQPFDQMYAGQGHQTLPTQSCAPPFWPYPPLSPLQVITQPPSIHPSPVAQATAPAGNAAGFDHTAPYWHVISTDPSGQRFVVHPLGGYCPCTTGPVSYPTHLGGYDYSTQNRPSEQSDEKQNRKAVQENYGQGGEQLQTGNGFQGLVHFQHQQPQQQHHQHLPYNAGLVAGPPFGFSPQYCTSQPSFPPLAVNDTATWPVQLQGHHQQQQQQQVHFPEPILFKPLPAQHDNAIRPEEGEGAIQTAAKGFYHGQAGCEGNPGPIQIPAWMNNGNC